MRRELICANSSEWQGSGIDLVLTNPYGHLPKCLLGLPSIISLYMARNDDRQKQAEAWLGGAELKSISKWGKGLTNEVFVAHLPLAELDLTDLVEDHERAPAHEGWFPLELPLRLLVEYARPGLTIWDGFMGRGTVGKACKLFDLGFVGIDKEAWRVALAKEYIG